MVATTTALVFATLATLATSGVDAHGTLVKPGLKFTGEGYGGNFAALVPMTALTPQQGDIFTNYPDWGLNAAAFGRAFKASKYTSLKEFLLTNQDMSKGRSTMPKTPECGFTDPTGGSVQPLPDQCEWYGGKMNHDGPCEIWCDDEIVLPFTVNCAVTYPDGKFPYKKAMCEDKKRLTMYWMSTLLEWQVYIDCAKIGEGGPPASASTTPSSGGTTPATSPGGSSGAAPASTPGDAPTTQNTNTGTIGGEASSTTKPKCTPKLRL
ncbi:hypothetical protein JG687_00010270 [Phytophthora cactorum]|uniref:Uncharacterized protein n=1 Tax=Phytophthora cactorum TaxID=29920 RepID=A0A8T1U7S3_9STRA|nr:hypothetical protein PC120_g3672 [Phytophthora cactorum]KAG3060673.1 hypothetical protein PC121_g13332 [Phytophthora cactorum]KAG3198142.1 hypothetical protein PC128_g6270 [Phytophthora cactorum]KAG4060354.1 hypothetical protein PC123_g4739 [Phytophthora cactorum]KAG6956979.1 hypothetical protein JG687_00010270 [Phytophthora cactorum]